MYTFLLSIYYFQLTQWKERSKLFINTENIPNDLKVKMLMIGGHSHHSVDPFLILSCRC